MKRGILGSLLMVAVAANAFATVIRVPSDYPTIQAGIDASSPGDTVLVGPGTYLERLVVDDPVNLIGENGAGATTLDADLLGPAIRSDDDIEVSGFRIVRGFPGFERTGGHFVLTDNIFEFCENAGYASAIDGGGGGVVERNVFRYSAMGSKGNATLIECSATSFQDNLIYANWGGYNLVRIVGRRDAQGNPAIISGNVIVDNVWGGTTVLIVGVAEITNNTIANNMAGAFEVELWDEHGNGDLTFTNNNVVSGIGGGLFCYFDPQSQYSVECNNAWSIAGDSYAGDCVGGVNSNISVDPLFCDPENGDYTLSANSPCAPRNSPCGLIGALGVGCTSTTAVVAAGVSAVRLPRLMVAPNPLRTHTEFRVEGATRGMLSIFDPGGRLVESFEVRDGAAPWRAPDGWPAGAYYVRFRGASGAQLTGKFLVVR